MELLGLDRIASPQNLEPQRLTCKIFQAKDLLSTATTATAPSTYCSSSGDFLWIILRKIFKPKDLACIDAAFFPQNLEPQGLAGKIFKTLDLALFRSLPPGCAHHGTKSLWSARSDVTVKGCGKLCEARSMVLQKDTFRCERGVEIAREERAYVIEFLPLLGEDTMTNQDDSTKESGVWGKMRIVIGLVLVAAISYEMGLAHARSEKMKGEYAALRAQYDQVLTESSSLRAQYDRVLTEYSASKTQCAETLTEYAALKNQYDRIEARRTSPAINQQKN